MNGCSGITKCALTHEEIYSVLYHEAQADAYISYLRGKRCCTETDFLLEVAASFQFPYYYGENWAAFDECIQDLDWLKFSRIFVVFDDFSESFSGQGDLQEHLQSRVIKYFGEASDYWKSEGKTMEIWFNN